MLLGKRSVALAGCGGTQTRRRQPRETRPPRFRDRAGKRRSSNPANQCPTQSGADPTLAPDEVPSRAGLSYAPRSAMPEAHPRQPPAIGAPPSSTVMAVVSDLDLDRLLKLRLVVARFGEMDLAKWWNTKGQLGRLGALALRRGFPRTHYFAQARSVIAVASHRCNEVFHPPGCVTLWQLHEELEEDFEGRWEHWLDSAATWRPFFERLESLNENDLTVALRGFDLVTDADLERFGRLRRSAEGHAVQLPGTFAGSPDELSLLALGFARGEVGELAVPYGRRSDV